MNAIIHKQLESIENIFPEWNQLKSNFHEITFFQEFGWIKSWWKSQSQMKDMVPYIVEIRENNRMIGIIPLCISFKEFASFRFRILKPIGIYLSDYLLPILSKEHPIEKQLKTAFAKIYEDKNSWDCIDWTDIPENSSFDACLQHYFQDKNKMVRRKRAEICPYLILNSDVDEIKARFSKKFLKGILYYERKLNREGELIYHRVKDEQDIEPIMHKLFELHCEKWGMTETPSQFRFIAERERAIEVAKNLYKNQILHLSYLKHNNEIAAIEFGMCDGVKRYLYIGAINVKFRKYPMGHILLYKLIIEACEEGYEIMDFLRGDEGYKQRAGTIDKYNVNYTFYNRNINSIFYRWIQNTYYSKQFQEKPRIKRIPTKLFIRGSLIMLNLTNHYKRLPKIKYIKV